MAFNPTVSLPGSGDGSTTNKDNFLTVFGGMVITAFDRSVQFKDKHTIRKIESGKSATFPVFGRLAEASEYLVQGESVAQGTITTRQVEITIDGFLHQSLFLSKQDEIFSHFDIRSVYAKQIGESMALAFDNKVARTGILAARATGTVPGEAGGSVITNASASTDGDALFTALFDARAILDEKDVTGEAYAFLRPTYYNLLASSEKVVSKDYNDDNGSFSTGLIKGVAGITLVKTNNMPSTDVTGTVDGKYDVDASNTVCLVMTKDCVGTVELMDITMDMDWMIEYQSYLMVAATMMGHGILRPECAVEIATA